MTAAQIKKSRIFSPGLIGGESVYFLSAEKDLFYIKYNDKDGYVKDNKNKYVKINIDEVIEARLLYWCSYGGKEKKQAINDEIKKMGKELVVKAEKIIKQIERFERIANKKYDDVEFSLMQLISKDYQEKQEKQAVAFFNDNPTAAVLKNTLLEMIEKKDYEGLYQQVEFEFGKALVTFKNGSDIDFTALSNLFGQRNIEKTISALEEKGALYVKAMAIVEKRYYPEK